VGDLPPGRYALLDASQAVDAGQQCSRTAPAIEAGWDLSDASAQAVERRLIELAEAPLSGPPAVGGSTGRSAEPTPDLARSFRQYVGAVVGGRRVIYVNAFPLSMAESDPDLDPTRLVRVCDGGASFWGVVFDPETGRFSDLAFNGPY